MMRESVASSNISSIGHDEPSETLEVEFSNGTIYQYFNVSRAVFDELMRSSSKGQFFNAYIKNSYPYSRVS